MTSQLRMVSPLDNATQIMTPQMSAPVNVGEQSSIFSADYSTNSISTSSQTPAPVGCGASLDCKA